MLCVRVSHSVVFDSLWPLTRSGGLHRRQNLSMSWFSAVWVSSQVDGSCVPVSVIFLFIVQTDPHWREEQSSAVSTEGMRTQQTPRSILSWEKIFKKKLKKLCWVENNNARTTLSTRVRKSFLVWTDLYLLEGEEGRGQRPGRMCFLPSFNCLGSHCARTHTDTHTDTHTHTHTHRHRHTHTPMFYSRCLPRVDSPYTHMVKSNLTRWSPTFIYVLFGIQHAYLTLWCVVNKLWSQAAYIRMLWISLAVYRLVN